MYGIYAICGLFVINNPDKRLNSITMTLQERVSLGDAMILLKYHIALKYERILILGGGV